MPFPKDTKQNRVHVCPADRWIDLLSSINPTTFVYGSIGLRTTHPFTNSISVIPNKVSMIPPSMIFLIDLWSLISLMSLHFIDSINDLKQEYTKI